MSDGDDDELKAVRENLKALNDVGKNIEYDGNYMKCGVVNMGNTDSVGEVEGLSEGASKKDAKGKGKVVGKGKRKGGKTDAKKGKRTDQ